MEKHQIGIIAGFVVAVLLMVALAVYSFSGDSEETTVPVVKADPYAELPEIPSEESQSYDTRVEEFKDDRDKEKMAQYQQKNGEIDLDLFGLEKEEEPVQEAMPIDKEESPPKATVKRKPSAKKTETKPEEPQPVELAKEEPKGDPDLIFSSNSFRTKGQVSEPVKDAPKKASVTAAAVKIKCVVHNEVTVSNGSRITLRTVEEFRYGSKTIPRNTYLYATVRYDQFRAKLELAPISFPDGSTLEKPVVAFDGNDLEEGIYARELLENKASKTTAGEAINEVNDNINSGLVRTVVKSFAQEKVREPEIHIYRNHPILIQSYE